MKNKLIALLISIITVFVSLSCGSVSFAQTLKEYIVNYTFDDSLTPTLFGNAKTEYDSERKSNVLVLDGSDNTYAKLPDNLFDGRDEVTVSMDIKPQTDNGNFFTFVIGKDSSYYNFLRIRGSEVRNAITVSSYTAEQDVKTNSAKTGSWMNLTLVIDGTKSSIYINGVLKAVNENTGIKLSDLGSGDELVSYIGKSLYDGDAFYKGCFDNFRVYDYALNDEEIEGIFNEQIDLYPLLNDVTVGTVSNNSGSNATDNHTAVSSEISNGVITSHIRPCAINNVPVNFSVLNDNVSIIIDSKKFVNGSTLDMTVEHQVTVSLGNKSESYLLKKPEIAFNSVLPGQYADPDIDYLDGKYWIFPTTDGTEGWGGTAFHAWSSNDMFKWTDEGVILDVENDNPGVNSNGIQIASSPWSDGNAWAPTIEEKNGKYYFYYCGRIKSEYLDTYATKNSDGNYNDKAIGVAVSDKPEGPYVASSSPIVYPKMMSSYLSRFSGQVIDPSVFTDDDGTSYLLFGNGNAAIVELNSDMTSVKTSKFKKINGMTDFRESVVIFKRQGVYYFTWSCDDTGSENYHIKYGTASKITTTFDTTKTISVSAKGVLMQKDTSNGILGTGHQSVLYLPDVDRLFLTYHRFYTPLGLYSSSGCHRETCIDELSFASSNTLAVKTPTMQGVGYGICPNGHDLSLIDYKLPSCTSDGSIVLKCDTCSYEADYNASDISYLSSFGHEYVKSVQKVSCDVDGYVKYTCSRCGDEYKTDYENAYGHMLNCIDNKEISYLCENCNETITAAPEDLMAKWNKKYINASPKSTNIDDSSYFELNGDGIINAKDYSLLYKAYKKLSRGS